MVATPETSIEFLSDFIDLVPIEVATITWGQHRVCARPRGGLRPRRTRRVGLDELGDERENGVIVAIEVDSVCERAAGKGRPFE